MEQIIRPSNVDFLDVGNMCNRHCTHCYYLTLNKTGITNDQEMIIIPHIAERFTRSEIFLYPKEITTSPHLLPLMHRFSQKSILSNGIDLTDELIRKLIEAGVKEIKITLFANYKQQCLFMDLDENQYEKIKNNISLCVKRGLKVTVNTVVSKETYLSIEELCHLCNELGVSKIIFIRLKPTGLAKNFDFCRMIIAQDMPVVINSIEKAKSIYKNNLYLSLSLSFGPNFYQKTIEQASLKVNKSRLEWTKSLYLCPSIENNYLGFSLKAGEIYWCFFIKSDPIAIIGEVDTKNGRFTINKNIDLTVDTLRKKLRGNCSLANCEYQSVCMGGCRSVTYLFAKYSGQEDPLYAGMDICLTNIYKELFK